jgi:hypothetical protein
MRLLGLSGRFRAGGDEVNADELVRGYVLELLRGRAGELGGGVAVEHPRTCPEVVVVESEATDGCYECDTGCEYVRLEALVRCPHGEWHFTWGNFGELAWIIEELEARAGGSPTDD